MVGRSIVREVAFLIWASQVSATHLRTINEKTAHKLVQEALAAMGESGASFEIGRWQYDWAPEFYTFSAWRPNPREGVLVTHYFAVNPWTGDVWDAMACKRISSPSIEKEQEFIWKRSRLSSDAREAQRKKSPGCSEIELKTGRRNGKGAVEL